MNSVNDTDNRLAGEGTYTCQYDKDRNRTRRTKASDASYTDYTYDQRQRLTSAVTKDVGGTVTRSVDYTYDAFDRLVKRVTDLDGAGVGAATIEYFAYDGHDVALTFDASGNLTKRYLNGPATDQVLAEEQLSSGVTVTHADRTYWALSDYAGTVRDIYNSAGALKNHLTYDAFGNVKTETASSIDFLYGFQGLLRDEATGLYLSQTRWLDPLTGKWLQEDWISFAGGDANLARFVGNSPTNYTDPTGKVAAEDIFWRFASGPLIVLRGESGREIWAVHHLIQQDEDVVAWAKANGEKFGRIGTVHDTSNLRSLPHWVHYQIGLRQSEFWLYYRKEAAKVLGKQLKEISLAEAISHGGVTWEDYQKHMQQIEETYGKYWLPVNANDAEIKRFLKQLGVSNARDLGSQGQVSFRKKVGQLLDDFKEGLKKKGLIKILGIIAGLIAVFENAKVAKGVCAPNEQQQAAFDAFLRQYEISLKELYRNGELKDSRRVHLQEKMTQWLNSIGADGMAKKFWIAMEFDIAR